MRLRLVQMRLEHLTVHAARIPHANDALAAAPKVRQCPAGYASEAVVDADQGCSMGAGALWNHADEGQRERRAAS
jgi:hypothetical protein